MADIDTIKILRQEINDLKQQNQLLNNRIQRWEEKMFFLQKSFEESQQGTRVSTIYRNCIDNLFPLTAFEEIPNELSDLKGLRELPCDFAHVPSGIYFLCKGGKIQYIGQTVNYGTRISAHFKDGRIDFDKVYFIQCHIDKLNEIERAFISFLKPPLNRKALGMPLKEAQEIIKRAKAA